MAQLKTTVQFQTTTLFPNPVNLIIPVIESITLDAGFSTAVVPIGGTYTVYGPTPGPVGTSLITYLYIQAAATNAPGDVVTIDITDAAAMTATVARLLPGNFLYIPIYANLAGVAIDINNSTGTAAGTFNYIIAERG